MAEPSIPELDVRRSTGKSPDAFRTIAEVSDELDVPQHVLRFWETRFPQIRPLKRGGGRRYYRPRDIAVIRRIRDLLYGQGYTIRGAQKVLRDNGAEDAAADQAGPEIADGAAVDLSPETRAALRAVLKDLEEIRGLIDDPGH
jgi:DNA-binding transcriptional MerR regulator